MCQGRIHRALWPAGGLERGEWEGRTGRGAEQVVGGIREGKEKGPPYPLTFRGTGALLCVCLGSRIQGGILQEFHPES